MKDGTALALGVVGIVAAASALARRGSSNAPTLTQLQQRMLRMWNQYPEQTAWRAQQVVDTVLFPRADAYLRDAEGWKRLQDDMQALSQTESTHAAGGVSSYFRNMIKDGIHWSEIAWSYVPVRYPATHPIEPLIPWIAKEVNRIGKKLPPISVRASDLQRGAGSKMIPLTLADIQRMLEMGPKTNAESTAAYRSGKNFPFTTESGFTFELGPAVQIGPFAVYMERSKADEAVVTWHLKNLLKSLPQIIDWYSSGEAGDLMPMTYEQAIKGEKKWHRALAAAAPTRSAARASTQGTTVATMTNPRGWTIRELAPSDLRPQSDAMGHCVGRSDTYRNLITLGKEKIYSVRDEQGRSIFTVEVQLPVVGLAQSGTSLRVKPARIAQFKGDKNRVPGLTKKKTGDLPSSWVPQQQRAGAAPYHERVRAWIDRASKPFVLREDAEAAAAATRELQRLHPGLTWEEQGDLVVPIALGMLTGSANRYRGM